MRGMNQSNGDQLFAFTFLHQHVFRERGNKKLDKNGPAHTAPQSLENPHAHLPPSVRTAFNSTGGVWLWGHLGKTLLFAFPEHQIQEAADESHGEADPGQDVGGTVGALPEADHVKAVLLLRVDGHCNHHTQGWKEEKDHWCQLSIKATKVGKQIRLALFSVALSQRCERDFVESVLLQFGKEI